MTWPKQGTWGSGHAYERRTLGLPTDASECLLLPTPSAQESTPTEDYLAECREAGIAPDERLYLPGRKWFAQRTLSRVVPTLLPTPQAADGDGGKQHRIGSITRTGYKEDGKQVHVSLRDAINLLPTPAARDHKGGISPESEDQLTRARGDGGRSDLPSAAMWVGRDQDPALLPTPTVADAVRGPDYARMDRDDAGGDDLVTATARLTKGRLRSEDRLLPTPTAMDKLGSRNSTAERRSDSTGHPGDTLTDAVTIIGGVRTRQRSSGGSGSPENEHPTLWTTEDD